MATDTTTKTERLVRSEIRAQMLRYTEIERDLTNRLADMFKNGRGGGPINNRLASAQDRARQMLNGSAHILPPAVTSTTGDEQGLQIEREAVRIILTALQKQDTEAETIEATEWAMKNLSAWHVICRDRILAAVRLKDANARIDTFLEGLTGPRRDALPIAYSWWEIDEDLITRAIKDGVVTAADIARARRGKGTD